jgi:fumarate hydratase subunit alpha
MRIIKTDEITKNVKEMCIEANLHLSEDMETTIRNVTENEDNPLGKQILNQLCENMDIAAEDRIPICQDTGMAVFFVNIGQDVHIEGMGITDAINEGVRQGYTE